MSVFLCVCEFMYVRTFKCVSMCVSLCVNGPLCCHLITNSAYSRALKTITMSVCVCVCICVSVLCVCVCVCVRVCAYMCMQVYVT
jgi:hypothetical protein